MSKDKRTPNVTENELNLMNEIDELIDENKTIKARLDAVELHYQEILEAITDAKKT